MKEWFHGVKTQGGSGIFVLVLIVGAVAWVLGKAQQGGGNGPSGPGGGPGGSAGGAGSYNTGYGSPPQGAGYQGGGAPPPPPRSSGQGPGAGHGGSYGNQHHYHQTPQSEPDPDATPPPGSEMPKPDPPKSSWGGSQKGASEGWEKAREETRRREAERKKQEEQRKKAEEERKQQEEAAKKAKAAAEKEKWEKMRQREKEAREREARERIARERLAKEKEAQEKAAKEKETQEAAIKAKLEREIREKLEAEELSKKEAADRAAKEASATADKAAKDREERLKAARERVEKLAKERSVFGVGERTNPYDGASPSVRSAAYRNSTNNYERPTAKSYMGTDDDGVTHSFRPYDEPRRPGARTANSFVYSEGRSSYAPSATTARTTPPPSQRGTYTTADPDKVVIKAVYLFNDLFPKPVAQLISGVGNVTDGLILRITTEGLFIDDDVRGVPQREWDVKAWTMKLVEVSARTYLSLDDVSLIDRCSGGNSQRQPRSTSQHPRSRGKEVRLRHRRGGELESRQRCTTFEARHSSQILGPERLVDCGDHEAVDATGLHLNSCIDSPPRAYYIWPEPGAMATNVFRNVVVALALCCIPFLTACPSATWILSCDCNCISDRSFRTGNRFPDFLCISASCMHMFSQLAYFRTSSFIMPIPPPLFFGHTFRKKVFARSLFTTHYEERLML